MILVCIVLQAFTGWRFLVLSAGKGLQSISTQQSSVTDCQLRCIVCGHLFACYVSLSIQSVYPVTSLSYDVPGLATFSVETQTGSLRMAIQFVAATDCYF